MSSVSQYYYKKNKFSYKKVRFTNKFFLRASMMGYFTVFIAICS